MNNKSLAINSFYLNFRCEIYKLLFVLFNDVPNVDLIKTLNKWEIEKVKNWNGKKSKSLLVNLKKLVSSLVTENIDKLKQDYLKLFLGPGKLLVPPWESVYTTGKRQVFQKSALEVKEFFLKCGFIQKDFFTTPPDHIATELEFMYLSAKEFVDENKNCNDKSEGLSLQKEFLEKHLLNWVPLFCKDLKNYSQTKSFSLLASFLNKFLLFELKFMNAVL